ncbi:MAG: hypothetical protein HY347_12655 [candidate division NC10 bacterium]|nr:hypothetical protein [candidate division NC10 bacterium]
MKRGVFRHLWWAGLLEYGERQGIPGDWPSSHGALTKAPLGGENDRAYPP